MTWKNQLYFGDNLDIMRQYIPDESVDLIYLDPPFNSKASYNVLFQEKDGSGSAAQITAFDDTWHWDVKSEEAFHELVTEGPRKLSDLIQALRSFLGQNDMMAYLTMMAVRLVEMHRVLKSSGSIYLHCDPNASHYLKLLMDAIFSPKHFQNEIIWKRTGAHGGSNRWGPIHDVILFYSKSNNFTWHKVFQKYDLEYIEQFYRFSDDNGRYRLVTLTGAGTRTGDSGKPWRGVDPSTSGRHWAVPNAALSKATGHKSLSNLSTQEKLDILDSHGLIYWPPKGKVPQQKRYLDESPGVPVQDIITDISPLSSQAAERLGYPTQKPEALLERIIRVSSNEGDIVFDPFCGCGTTISASEKLNRKWLGIDITHLAITLMKHRLEDSYGTALSPYEVHGDPQDLSSAIALAEQDKYQFEWWALGKVAARPAQEKRKGSDKGVDGYIYFFDDNGNQAKKIVVQVKGGHVTASHIRDLKGVLAREKAEIGAFITLNEPTRPMKEEAAASGFYFPDHFPGKHFPRLQILTIEELLNGKELLYPKIGAHTFKKAQRQNKGQVKQMDMF